MTNLLRLSLSVCRMDRFFITQLHLSIMCYMITSRVTSHTMTPTTRDSFNKLYKNYLIDKEIVKMVYCHSFSMRIQLFFDLSSFKVYSTYSKRLSKYLKSVTRCSNTHPSLEAATPRRFFQISVFFFATLYFPRRSFLLIELR